MEVSGEVADLVVKEGLQVTEAAAKLAGKGVVNVAALLAALAKEHYKVAGKTGISRLAKDNAQAVVVPVKAGDMKQFRQLARQYGVLYAAVKPRGKAVLSVDIISNVNYAAQINAIFEAMGYPIPEKAQEDKAAKKATPLRTPRGKSSPERESGLHPPQTEQTSSKPSTRGRLMALQQAAKELERSSPDRTPNQTR